MEPGKCKCRVALGTFDKLYQINGYNTVLTAFMWFLPSMCHHMSSMMNFTFKRLVTLTALIWFFTSVCHHMIC